jgi:hypothetical protein
LNIRSRLVGRELNLSKRDDLFAGTPPLESLRYVVSRCASTPGNIIKVICIKRAYFYAPATRAVYIEMPEEDRVPGDEMMVGKLNLSLYGTRDAALNWTKSYTELLVRNGFIKGRHSAQNFYHPTKDIALTVHGDDFTITGQEGELEWLEKVLTKAYEVKVDTLGPDPRRHKQEVRVLNSVLCWENGGITYEADPRHAEMVIRDLGLENAKPVNTPGTREEANKALLENGQDFTMLDPEALKVKDRVKTLRKSEDPEVEGVEDEKLLKGSEATTYRAICARLNYLSQDRPDIRYSVKEASRSMANPREGDWGLLKRIGRYLVATPRLRQWYSWQNRPSSVTTFVDSEWAGCRRTCRSTSGGAMMIGTHNVSHWSTTQALVALSSGEAELYAMIKGAAHTLGLISLAADFGEILQGRVRSDASAAIGIINRTGVGKLRHVRTQFLWLQDKVRASELEVKKVPGEENPADLMTKNVPEATMRKHLLKIGYEPLTNRAATAPTLSRISSPEEDRIRDKERGPAQEDYWEADGLYWVRHHCRPRLEAFTPIGVAGAPKFRDIEAVRISTGRFEDGSEFDEVDSWKTRSTTRCKASLPWTGTTIFVLKTADC